MKIAPQNIRAAFGCSCWWRVANVVAVFEFSFSFCANMKTQQQSSSSGSGSRRPEAGPVSALATTSFIKDLVKRRRPSVGGRTVRHGYGYGCYIKTIHHHSSGIMLFKHTIAVNIVSTSQHRPSVRRSPAIRSICELHAFRTLYLKSHS